MQASPTLYARGPYRVAAHPAAEADGRYLVIDTAGTWLHEAPGFDDACRWVDARVATLDATSPVRARTPAR